MTSAKRKLVFVMLIALIAAGTRLPQSTRAQDSDLSSVPWPTEEWATAAPESQGVDSEKLIAMLRIIDEQDLNINSVTVIRHGYVVLDAYLHPYAPDELHMLHSVTKSFTSALIGIAIDEGYLTGVDQRVAEIFPNDMPDDADPRKAAMTLADLLTMATGLNCRDSASYSYQGMQELWDRTNWVEYILALPMREDPGTRFEYCNSASFLLAAIIQVTTGQTALDYARAKLFGPLGIDPVIWPANPDGITIGWGEMHITPRDMAKFGYLYLQDGTWDGAQIVPAEWIAASTTPYIHVPAFDADYGYQWWIESADFYAAEGTGGQYIIVAPQFDLAAVFTSGLSERLYRNPLAMFENLILAAVTESGDPLPDNPAAVADLAALVDQLAHPAPKPVPPLPEIAGSVSGAIYELDPSDSAWKSITLTFETGADVATLYFSSPYEDYTFPIGLDGLFRTTAVADGVYTHFRGEWIKDRFVVNERMMYTAQDVEYVFSFEGDRITFTIHERVNESLHRFSGTRRQ